MLLQGLTCGNGLPFWPTEKFDLYVLIATHVLGILLNMFMLFQRRAYPCARVCGCEPV
jgi:hypothetical protein